MQNDAPPRVDRDKLVESERRALARAKSIASQCCPCSWTATAS